MAYITGTPDADTLYGTDGDDYITGSYGDDRLLGGAGNDELAGGDGNDSLEGGEGNDLLWAADYITDTGNSHLSGGSGADTLYGGVGADTLTGGSEDDELRGRRGNDLVFGDEGNDVLLWTADDDSLYGGTGNDTISLWNSPGSLWDGVVGSGIADGGPGIDVLDVHLGIGSDVVVDLTLGTLTHSNGVITIQEIENVLGSVNSSDSSAALTIIGNEQDNSLVASLGTDTIYGMAGNDTIEGGSTLGEVNFYGGQGDDLIYLYNREYGLFSPVVGGYVEGGEGSDTILGGYYGYGEFTIDGGDGNDSIFSSQGSASILGGAGDDTITSLYGDDSISGGSGNDSISSDIGNDTLDGGEGDDSLYGGGGDDTLKWSSGNDSINGGSGSSDNDTLELAGLRSDFSIQVEVLDFSTALIITNKETGDRAEVSEVEWLQFNDLLIEADYTPHSLLSVVFSEGDWQDHGNGSFTASGTAIIGLSDGNTNMLSATGDFTLTETELKIDGKISSIIDGQTRDIYDGEFTFNLYTASGAFPQSGQVVVGDVVIAGLIPEIYSLTLSGRGVELDWSTWEWQGLLSDDAGPLDISIYPDTVVITPGGMYIGLDGTVGFPDTTFILYDLLTVSTSNWSVSYDFGDDALTLLGGIEIDTGWEALPSVEAALTEPNGLTISDGEVQDVSLSVNIPALEIRGWGFKDLAFALDTEKNEVTGQGTLVLPVPGSNAGEPGSISASVDLTLDPFELDGAQVSVGLIDPGIPVATTGFFVNEIGGGVSNLASTNENPVLFTGMVGIDGYRGLLDMDITGSIDVNHVEGSVQGTFIEEDVVSFEGTTGFSWRHDYQFTLNGEASMILGFITADLNVELSGQFDQFKSTGKAQIDFSKAVTGWPTASGNYALLYSDDEDDSNDYIVGWTSYSVTLLNGSVSIQRGVKVDFNGEFTTIGAEEIQEYSSWIIEAGMDNLLVDVTWENPSAEPVVTRVIVYDDLAKTQVRQIIEEADYAANNIVRIEEWSTEQSTVIYVDSPEPGLWDVEIVDPTGLGDIGFSASTTSAPGSIQVDGVSIADSVVTIDFTTQLADSNGNVQFFVDTDDRDFDGVFITSAAEEDGTSQLEWDATGFSGGDYWVYAMLEDGQIIPVFDYAENMLAIAGLFEGTYGDDELVGFSANDTLVGFEGRDVLEGRAGDDEMDGGDDIDIARYNSELLDYSILTEEGVITVQGPGNEGTDTLINIERLHFDDSRLAFDLDGNAGSTAKLLGVLIGKDNWDDPILVGIGLDIFDNYPLSFEEVMSLGLDVILGTDRSNADVVNMVYTNLIGAAPSEADLNTLTADLLDSGAFTQTGLAVLAADHPFNLANIDLVGLSQTGVEYLMVG